MQAMNKIAVRDSSNLDKGQELFVCLENICHKLFLSNILNRSAVLQLPFLLMYKNVGKGKRIAKEPFTTLLNNYPEAFIRTG